MKWRIYYGDGSTYSDRDGSPYEAPAVNVQCIANEEVNERGFTLCHGTTVRAYYCWRDGGWFITDEAGFYDYLMLLPGPKKVIFGRTMERTDAFWALIARAGREGLG